MTAPATPALGHNVFRGLAFVVGAVTCFAFLDAIAKWLSQSYPTGQVVWTRYTVGTLFAVAYASRALGFRMFRTARPWLQFTRGLLLVVCTALNFVALNYLPLADTLAVLFTSPLMTCALSVPLLGEKVGWRRWSAIAVGFAGILLIVRPGFAEVHWAVLCALGAAFFGALYNIATRVAAAHDSVQVSLVYVSLVGALLATPALSLGWVTPGGWDWGLFLALGLCGGFGHLLLISAFAHAPASTLAPFSYTQILWTTILGYLLFDRLPDLWTVAGIVVIICSGLYLLHRERLLGRGIAARAEPQER
jgi:drug/metabolite transporter (DMT)-like permease